MLNLREIFVLRSGFYQFLFSSHRGFGWNIFQISLVAQGSNKVVKMFMSEDLYDACVPGARVNWVSGNNPDHNAVYDEEGSCSHT